MAAPIALLPCEAELFSRGRSRRESALIAQ